MTAIFYSTEYVISGHEFDTTRKSSWIVESLSDHPIVGLEVKQPKSLTESEILEIHAPEYVRAVRGGQPRYLAESQGFPWDERLWRMVAASNGGAVEAARLALRESCAGSLSSGIHHAYRDHGGGFCTFNGLALAAKAALYDGARNGLIVDLDAHCGGGTHSLLANDPRIWQMDVSVDRFDVYLPTERFSRDLIWRASDYLPTIRRRLAELDVLKTEFDLCLYYAGVDPFERCSVGGLRGIDKEILEERDRTIFEWCRKRGTATAFYCAGGYKGSELDEDELVLLHRLTLSAAMT